MHCIARDRMCVGHTQKSRHAAGLFTNFTYKRGGIASRLIPLTRRLRLLRRVRHAPAFCIDRLAGEQLAWSAPGRAAGVELAIRTVVAGFVLGVRRLRSVLDIAQGFCHRIALAQRRQIGSARKSRQTTDHRSGYRGTGGNFQEPATRFDICFIRHGATSIRASRLRAMRRPAGMVPRESQSLLTYENGSHLQHWSGADMIAYMI